MADKTCASVTANLADSKEWLAQFIHESNAIENIYDPVDSILNRIRRKSKCGHVGAMLMLGELAQAQRNITGHVTKELVCKIQGLITAEQNKKPGGHKLPKEFVGQYRSGGMKVGNKQTGYRVCPLPDQVPKLMGKLLRVFYRWWQNAKTLFPESNIVQIADFHLVFLMIHPFADGNGRTARALAYFMFVYAGLKPIIFTSRDRQETYYPCFDNPEDFSVMRRYFFSKIGIDPNGLV